MAQAKLSDMIFIEKPVAAITEGQLVNWQFSKERTGKLVVWNDRQCILKEVFFTNTRRPELRFDGREVGSIGIHVYFDEDHVATERFTVTALMLSAVPSSEPLLTTLHEGKHVIHSEGLGVRQLGGTGECAIKVLSTADQEVRQVKFKV